ncbi:MoxR family ATPase [Chamaesiphon sp. VAR_48_metabat_135_sub]|uniref:AAA family ATPase n=1 Tax=Chamaesiphon sp. VAR_48_metabat_135_sub TaxID=2964699 RepID=UPI00286BAD95|nr:MoxR family ATPase [Chamaesiphon sp. VAR_48_metabat_135_sub]
MATLVSPSPIQRLTANIAQQIVGKDRPIQLVLTALLSGGHVLLEDVPGVGKTLLAKSLAKSIDGKFQRIQCTPDLLPSDITGTNIWNPGSREFQFIPGPVFTNILLTDEINRATPRTQSALLEVMEERQVTLDGQSRAVPAPFFVIATQNPIESHGTFALPEAQMDRFAISLSLGYPDAAGELQMLQGLATGTPVANLEPCISLEQLQAIQQQCQQIKVDLSIQQYIIDLVRATRNDSEISLGVSPRGSVALYRATQAWAWLQGRSYALPDDVKELALYVLSHRIMTIGGRRGTQVITRLLQEVPVDASGDKLRQR